MADDVGAAIECAVEQIGVRDVQLLESGAVRNVRLLPGRQVVDDDHLVASSEEGVGHVRADEARATGDDHAH